MSFLLSFILFILVACASPAPEASEPTVTFSVELTLEPEMTAVKIPTAVAYNLGETTIVQSHFPEDSRFRDMPVRLNGIIAAPSSGTAFRSDIKWFAFYG